jgi:rhodanese-related sulfurtransferase
VLVSAAAGAGHAVFCPLTLPSVAEGLRVGEGFVTAREAHALSAMEEIVFLDASSVEDHARGRIPGAWHLPWEAFASGDPPIMMDLSRTQAIVVYCHQGCDTALLVAQRFRDAGFARTLVINDGFEGWVAAGFAVERDR